MVNREELLEIANATGLTPPVVEKDYVLGWILHGISQHAALRERSLFKGGTCLKKCYFETYRFSEDLDFTLRDEAHIDEAFLRATFAEISQSIYEKSGLEFPADRSRFEIYENPRGRRSCQARLYFRSQFQAGNNFPAVKLDLTADELIAEPVVKDIGRRDVAVPVDSLLDPFLLQTAEEGFCACIVPTVSPAAHAGLKMIGSAKTAPVSAPILRALVGMNDRATRAPSPHGHHDGIERELAGERRFRGPADNVVFKVWSNVDQQSRHPPSAPQRALANVPVPVSDRAPLASPPAHRAVRSTAAQTLLPL